MSWDSNFGFSGGAKSGAINYLEELLDTDFTSLANSIIIYNATTGQWETAESIASWAISDTALYKDGDLDAESAGMASADYPFYAGAKYANRASAPFRVTPDGALVATNATVTGNISSTTGTIGGWYIDSSKLRSAAVGAARIELDQDLSRISVKDSANAFKVVMGYLEGLNKHDISGTWSASDYGFWAQQGDSLVIDGDVQYTSGDWIVENDGSFRIKNNAGATVIRLGTDGGMKGLFLYNASEQKLIEFTTGGINLLVPGAGTKYGAANYNTFLYGTGRRASIHNTGKNVPFYCESNAVYGDCHFYDRVSDPTGAAEVGDVAMVGGVLKYVTAAGTPGTWAAV